MELPRVAYSIFLACAFGACSPDDDASYVCKPVPNAGLEPQHGEHQAVCNNATFHWMINTLLAEISSQKDELAGSQAEIDRIKHEGQIYQSAYQDYRERYNQQMKEIEKILVEYDKLQERNGELIEENTKQQEEIKKLQNVQQQIILPQDCGDIQKQGSRYSGLYTVFPNNLPQGLEVFCDLESAGGGWLVIQRRVDGVQRFDRDWNEYKRGFGQMAQEFWLGNEYIHHITQGRVYELRVDMMDFTGNQAFASYDHFSIDDESVFYKLRLGYYTGNAGDALSHHKDQAFSTKDVDNDLSRSGHCSKLHGSGGWWYVRCYDSNLNGVYKEAGEAKDGIVWFHLHHSHVPIRQVSMKLRPVDFNHRT